MVSLATRRSSIVEGRVSGLRRDAFTDDGVSRAAQTVPAHTGRTTARQSPRTVSALHPWLARARATGIVLIQHFESRLQGDILAVEAAVTEPWSNGPVEGQVNRLKTIKRQMYGRAGVELLRARLIPLAP
jgi:transposase